MLRNKAIVAYYGVKSNHGALAAALSDDSTLAVGTGGAMRTRGSAASADGIKAAAIITAPQRFRHASLTSRQGLAISMIHMTGMRCGTSISKVRIESGHIKSWFMDSGVMESGLVEAGLVESGAVSSAR